MTSASPSAAATASGTRRLALAAVVLGVALSAFFDGILLHQVLQWHHLLSLADGATWRDLHNQILADGLFHVFVYLVMLFGLYLLWRARPAFSAPGVGRRIWADMLIGFGLWNVVDVVGFHWLAGLHRVRVDVAEALPWDIGWLVVLGAVPLAAGAWLRRRPGGRGGGVGAAQTASAAVLLAGTAAAFPPAGQAGAVVVFRPDVSPAHAVAAVATSGGLIASVSPSGRAMIVVLPDNAARWSLYSRGALVVGGGGLAGCGVVSL